MNPADWLQAQGERARERFEAERRVLSFSEYLCWAAEVPELAVRDASTYLRDMLDHFGTYIVSGPGGPIKRYRVFDGVGDSQQHLVGHEQVQQSFYAALTSFVREGHANRLVLLHGPNGSAKSTFVHCLFRGLEVYSRSEEGALYTFSWVFPRGKDGKTIGFGSTDLRRPGDDTFAHLPEADIDVRLASEVREHPLHLIGVQDRASLLEGMVPGKTPSAVPTWLRHGEMSSKNKQIFDALLTAYRGDLQRVLSHVRVERYYVSERYRVGAATIGPEMAVDAQERQITADHSLGALPASFASLTLYESIGALADGNGGVLEYSDLLKRPLDAWKYLLAATETGTVSLSRSTLALNSVLIASSNEVHLAAFREHHEYRSFRGRLQPICVPYLRDYLAEQTIYERQIVPQLRAHVAPHVTFVAALWATLTRLHRPLASHFDDARLGALAASLAPLEKAELYALGQPPKRLKVEERRLLQANRKALYEEYESGVAYEGLVGASAREIRALLLEAGEDAMVTPLDVFDGIEAMIEAGDYEFLKLKSDGAYLDHAAFVDVVRERWLERVDDEFRTSAGFVDDGEHESLFRRYVLHVSYWVKDEKITNPHTGESEDPDVELMQRIESTLAAKGEEEDFRRQVIGKVAAHAIDNPDHDMNYVALFPKHVEALREAYYEENRSRLADLLDEMLAALRTQEEKMETRSKVQGERLSNEAAAALETLRSRFGYQDENLRPVLSALRTERYT